MFDAQRGTLRHFECFHAPALCRFSKNRLLTSLLTAIVINVSVTTQLAAQRANLAIVRNNKEVEDATATNSGQSPRLLIATNFRDAEEGDIFSDMDSAAESRWIGPLRSCECGVSIEPVYYGEVFTNAQGGISTNGATRYQALLDLPVTFDFEKMRLPLPGRFFLLAQNTHGRGISEDFVGDTLVLSDIDSFHNVMQVGEYWWESSWLTDDVIVRLGKQDVNTEFAIMDLAEDFIQSTFELTPSATLPTYPDQSMAAVVLMQLKESLQLKVGIWDALANGESWGFSGNDTVLVIGELEYTYTLFDGTLPGTLGLGAGYMSDGELAAETLAATHGYYAQLEQLVYRECTCDPYNDQGLAVFAAYYPRFLGPQVLTKTIGDSAVAGLVYTGLISQRGEDTFGAGVAWAELFQGGTNQETVYELFYKTQITPRISLQPDLQYIVSPSGIHGDAFAVGVRFQVAF
jgi:porin